MLKPLLLILTLVIIAALILNIEFLSTQPIISTTNQNSTLEKLTQKSSIVEKKQSIPSKEVEGSLDDNLSKEIELLLKNAEKFFRNNQDDEALLLYDKIISKAIKSKDLKVLKLFAQACFEKATLHSIYPNHDFDLAIESYELIVDKLEHSRDKELLLLYMQAKLKQAQLSSKEDLLIAYDELIEKFESDKKNDFNKEIDELLFAKSFALMGIDDEEAIEVLDTIIAKYSDKNNLPDTVKYSILNNIELSIITANETEKYVDLAKKYMANSPDTKPLLGMLEIIKNAQELDQSEALKAWQETHGEYHFPDWDFSELRKWANTLEGSESQKRVLQYLDLFEKQKYKNIYIPEATVAIDPIYSDEATQNSASLEEKKDSQPIEEMIEEQNSPIYEPDPYQNDLMGTEAEITYPNPYSHYEPNPQTDGVSYTYGEEER